MTYLDCTRRELLSKLAAADDSYIVAERRWIVSGDDDDAAPAVVELERISDARWDLEEAAVASGDPAAAAWVSRRRARDY